MGLHGVLVRPRFLPDSSASKAGIETLGAGDSDDIEVPGGRVLSLGLCDARLLRGLRGVDGGCNRSALGLGASTT